MMSVQRRLFTGFFVCATAAAAFYAGVAYAADSRLDEADAAIQKAIGLLEAAQNPGVTPPFGGHREKAIKDLKQARTQIEKSRQYADNPPKPKGKGKKKND